MKNKTMNYNKIKLIIKIKLSLLKKMIKKTSQIHSPLNQIRKNLKNRN
jgi:hypothetical protein